MHAHDKLANTINHDRTAFNRRIRFCPSCGVDGLARHERIHDPVGKPIQGSEFWCVVCGFSFNVRTSVEWNIALKLFRDHRKLRGGMVRYEAKYVEPSVLEIWKQTYEQPPKSGTYSLGEKLKAALCIGERSATTK